MRTRYNIPLIMCACAGVLSSVASVAQTPEDSEPILEYSRDPDVLVISFDVRGDFRDDVPLVRIYGDGRLHVHRDRGQDYEAWLSDAEVRAWLRYFYDNGILTFDDEAVRNSVDQIRQERYSRSQSRGESLDTGARIAGGLVVVVEIWLEAFKPEGPASERVDRFFKRIAWDQPRAAATEFPEIPELANLADVTDALLELRRVNGG